MVSGDGRDKHYDPGDDDDFAKATPGRKRKFDEFECPTCSAHNPAGDAFGNGDDVFCGYCGQSFVAVVNEDGVLKLKET
jgi:transcription elongation factor Elf1